MISCYITVSQWWIHDVCVCSVSSGVLVGEFNTSTQQLRLMHHLLRFKGQKLNLHFILKGIKTGRDEELKCKAAVNCTVKADLLLGDDEPKINTDQMCWCCRSRTSYRPACCPSAAPSHQPPPVHRHIIGCRCDRHHRSDRPFLRHRQPQTPVRRL